MKGVTEYMETVSSLYFSLAAQCTEYDVEDVFTAYAYAGAFKMSCALSDFCSSNARTQTESASESCFAMPFASIAPSTWLANAEISTVSTPSQKHPASFQVFSNDLHAIDVGLAHFVTSGITEHVETLGVLFVVVVVSLARATEAPQQITTKKEKKYIFLFDGSIVFARSREDEREREEKKREKLELNSVSFFPHAISSYANALNRTTDRVSSTTVAKEIRIKYATTNRNKYKERGRENKSLALAYRAFVIVVRVVVARAADEACRCVFLLSRQTK
jgi:hypothetical protein